jgi:predicted metallo-beta-lactamase superfamily hydrolase
MLKQRESLIVISFDDTHNGTHHEFESDNMEQAVRKAERLLELTKSGSVVLRHSLTDVVFDYFEK